MKEKDNNEVHYLSKEEFNKELEQQVDSVFKIFENYNENKNKDAKR